MYLYTHILVWNTNLTLSIGVFVRYLRYLKLIRACKSTAGFVLACRMIFLERLRTFYITHVTLCWRRIQKNKRRRQKVGGIPYGKWNMQNYILTCSKLKREKHWSFLSCCRSDLFSASVVPHKCEGCLVSPTNPSKQQWLKTSLSSKIR